MILLYAGLLYLFGISVMLMWKPDMMFTREGNWKEFGIGRRSDRYTWLPFWMFAILWAVLSYTIVFLLVHRDAPTPSLNTVLSSDVDAIDVRSTEEVPFEPKNLSSKLSSNGSSKSGKTKEMKPGYYILNIEETKRHGIPKYVYLGPETPNVLFHSLDDNSD